MLMNYLDRGKAAGEFPQDLDSAVQAVSIGSYLLGVALQQKLHPSLDINLLKPAAYSLIPLAPESKQQRTPRTNEKAGTTL